MHRFCVLVLFLLCCSSVNGLYVGNNSSSSSNNGLFNFNSNNTPDGNNNAARLMMSEGIRQDLLSRRKPAIYLSNDIGFGDAFLTLRENIGDEERS